jgi:hypothetical protein
MITTRQKLTRYGGSLAVVLGVHALAIALALNWTARPPIELPPQAMMVELAPVPPRHRLHRRKSSHRRSHRPRSRTADSETG